MHVHIITLNNNIYIHIYIIYYLRHTCRLGTCIYVIKTIIQITYCFPETGYSKNVENDTITYTIDR